MSVSLERCRSQWTVCQDTVRYAVPGPACATLIEKFLQEADPQYASYTSCTLSGAAGSAAAGAGAGASAASGSAQAVAMERRRKVKCPVQLHAQHAILAEAYMLLYDHMWVQYQQAEQSGSGMLICSYLSPCDIGCCAAYIVAYCISIYSSANCLLNLIRNCGHGCHAGTSAVLPAPGPAHQAGPAVAHRAPRGGRHPVPACQRAADGHEARHQGLGSGQGDCAM